MTKIYAFLRKDLIEEGIIQPDLSMPYGEAELKFRQELWESIDWTKEHFLCYQPDELDNDTFNLILVHEKYGVLLGRSIDFDFETYPYEISIRWLVDDVLARCSTLTIDEAKQVLKQLDRKHDANIGINWDQIDFCINELFPDRELDCQGLEY